MTPDLQPVHSSLLAAVGYDAQTRQLYVRFLRTQALYVFHDLDEAVYKQLLAAGSMGDYFNEEIRDRYHYTRV